MGCTCALREAENFVVAGVLQGASSGDGAGGEGGGGGGGSGGKPESAWEELGLVRCEYVV